MTAAGRRTRRVEVGWVVGGGLVVAGHAAAMRALGAGSQVATDISVGLLIVVAVLAAVAAGRTARGAVGRARVGWALLAAGMGCWAFGEGVWSYYVSFRRVVAPFPGIGDAGYLSLVPLVLGGMMALAGRRQGALRLLLDGLVVAGSLLVLGWAFVLEPVYRAGNLSPAAKAVSLAYPIGDVVLAAMALVLVRRAGRGRRAPALLIAAGALALSVGDFGFAYLNQHGTYKCGSVVDTGWVAGFVLMAFAARQARRDGVGRPAGEAPSWIALPYVPLAVALVASCLLYAERGALSPFLYGVVVIVVLLVVARQLLALRDNLLLTRDLERVVRDLGEREAQLRHLAYHDPLTGLANRALFQQCLDGAGGRHTALLYLDLDGFKPVNDTFGHAAGDALLVAVAGRLLDCAGPTDVVARLGGDEFAVLLDREGAGIFAGDLAGRVSRRLSEPYDIHGRTVTVGVSVGVARCEPRDGSAAMLMPRADAAMYAAKTRNRGRRAVLPGLVAR